MQSPLPLLSTSRFGFGVLDDWYIYDEASALVGFDEGCCFGLIALLTYL